MAVQLRELATRLTGDSSSYVRAAEEAARAATKAGKAVDELGREVARTDGKTGSVRGFDALKRQLDPLAAAQDRLTKSTATLNRALELGRVAPEEHAKLLATLRERYDLAGQAAAKAAKAQEDAAKASAAAAAEEAAGLARLRGKYDESYTAAQRYNTALQEVATLQRAGALTGEELAKAQARVEAELNPVNVALNKQKAELDALRASLDPASAAAKRHEQQQKTLREAFEAGTISGLEYDSMLRKLRDQHDGAAAGAAKAGHALRDVLGEGAREAASHVGFAGEAILSLGRAGAGAAAGIAAAGVAVAALVAASIPAAGEFQKLQASLRTVGGSAQLAAAEFDMIKEFALATPMSVEQVTQAFIKLKAMGLDPSMEALRSYGNTAGAMGKSVQDMVEAVADATTGEFERLKEFGIKSAQEGNKVTFTFQGIKTTVGNNAAEIQKYLLAIGNTKFATGMAEQSATLSGAIDELSDNWQIFLANLGNSGPVQAATALIRALADAISGLNSMLFPSIKEQITATRGEVETLRREIAEMEKFPDAYGPELEGRRKVLVEREKSLAALVKEQAEREKLIATSRTQTKVEEELDQAAKKEIERRKQVTDRLDIEWDERNRLLQATREGKAAVIALNRELEGERAIREFLGVSNTKEALQKMEGNKTLAEQARRVQDVARANYDLKISIDAEAEAQKASTAARTKAIEENIKAAEKFEDEVRETSARMSADVAENLFDSLTDPDQKASVIDFFKSIFKRIAVEALASKVILPIMTQVVGGAPSMFGISAPAGGQAAPGATSDPMSFANSASNIWSTVSGMSGAGTQAALGSGSVGATGMGASMASSINAFGASTMGFAPGTVAAAPSAAFVGPMPMATGTSTMAGGTTLTAGLGAGLGGAAVGGMIGSLVGNATQSRAIGAGTGALTGAAAGFMMGGPIGAAIGAVGGALMAALGTAGKPSNKEGNASLDLSTGRTRIGGQEGEKFSQENRDAAAGAARAFGTIGGMMGDFSDRRLGGQIRVVMGDRDGMSAQFGDAKISFKKRNDDAMRDMTRWFVDQFAAQLGQDLPGDVRTALQRIDWRDVETALEDVAFAGTFRDRLKALQGGFGLIDEATESTRAEVKALTNGIIEFKAQTARLGLDTAAATEATRSFVEGVLGIRQVAAPMTAAETAVALLKVRFDEMAPLLAEVGIHAGEAARGLERAIAALRDDFVAGLDREFNELSGNKWINDIDDTFAVFATRMRDAAALGGGSAEVMRNNHVAIRNIMEELSDQQLGEAAARYGGDIATLADAIRAARAVVGEAAPALGAAVMDVAGFLATLEREANESSGRGHINQIRDQFSRMNEQLGLAARAGTGADIVLANNHRAMVNLLNSLGDPQLADAAQQFGGNIAIIADSIRDARAAVGAAGPAIAQGLFDVGAWLRDLGREANDLSGAGYVNAVTDQFARMTEQLAIAERVGAGANEVLSNNHLAMVRIMEALSDAQLTDAANRFGGGIAEIARALIAGRAATAAAAAAQEAATRAAQFQADAVEAAADRVDRAREQASRAYQREIDAQQALSNAAKDTADNMRRFATGFRDFRQSLNTSDLSSLSPVDRYNAARAEFESVAGRAAGGDQTAMAQLEQVSRDFLTQSRAYFASSSAYASDFQTVQQALISAEASAQQQASAADQALAQAQHQTAILQAQLAAIEGNTGATLSVAAAVQELTAALLHQQQVAGGASSNQAYVQSLYQGLLGREAEAGGLAAWTALLDQGMSRAEVERLIKASAEGQARGYAYGGMVTNGTWNRDSVTAMLAGGEFVTRAPSVNSGTLATLTHINRTGALPANSNGGELAALRDDTRRQTMALQDGFQQLLRLTERQTRDIADLRSAQRRQTAA